MKSVGRGQQRLFARPFYARYKQHYCPKCKSVLSLIKVSKVVNSKSPEAKDYDFSSFDFTDGDVKFIWDEFVCPACDYQISIRDMALIEKKEKYKAKGKEYKENSGVGEIWEYVIFLTFVSLMLSFLLILAYKM